MKVCPARNMASPNEVEKFLKETLWGTVTMLLQSHSQGRTSKVKRIHCTTVMHRALTNATPKIPRTVPKNP